MCRLIACLSVRKKGAFLEGKLLSSQSEQVKNLSKSSDWLEKIGPPKKATLFLTCIRL